MKKLRNTALLIVLGASLAIAQGPRGQHHRGEMMKKHIERLDSIVDLTEEQESEIESLQEALKIKMKDARLNKDREAMKSLRKQHKTDIEAILTDEQIDILKKSREAHRAEIKEMHKALKAYKHEQIKPTLQTKRTEFDNNLSEEEKATITSLRKEVKAMRKAYKESGTKGKLSQDERKAKKEKMAAVLDPIIVAHKAELEAIEEDLAPLKATWEADIKEIKAEHTDGCEGKCARRGMKHKKGRKAANNVDKTSFKYYRFLLMNIE